MHTGIYSFCVFTNNARLATWHFLQDKKCLMFSQRTVVTRDPTRALVTPRGRPHASYCCETTQLCRTAAAATALGLAVGVAVPKQDAFVRTASRDGRAVVPTSRPYVTPPLLQLLLPLKQMSRRPPCLLLYHLPLNLCLCPHRLLCLLPRGQ